MRSQFIAKNQNLASATRTLELFVVDENDEGPKFSTPSGFIFNSFENFQGPVGVVAATDPDSEFKFEVSKNEIFEIDSQTGLIFLKKKLKNRIDPIVGVRVKAIDAAGQSDAINVLVRILLG